jgi:hypothetical protein
MSAEGVRITVHATIQDSDEDPEGRTQVLWNDFCERLQKLISDPKYRDIYLM